jgi:hypothetical protein
MRAILVLALDRFFSYFSNLLERFKDMGIEYFMPVSSIKAFNKGILLWLIRLDKLQFNAFLLAPTHKDSRAKFTPII